MSLGTAQGSVIVSIPPSVKHGVQRNAEPYDELRQTKSKPSHWSIYNYTYINSLIKHQRNRASNRLSHKYSSFLLARLLIRDFHAYNYNSNNNNNNNNTQKAAIATLPLTTHPQWAEPHTFTSLEPIHAPITSLEWLNLPLLPFLPFHNLPS